MNLIEAWLATTTAFAARLAEVTEHDRARRTPCEAWSVAQLVDHVFEIQTRTPTALGRPVGDHERTLSGWHDFCKQSAAVVAEPGQLERTVTTSLGEMPASAMLTISMADCLTHTWDLSRALGLNDSLPEQPIKIALDFMRTLDPLLRGPGMLKTKLPPPSGASATTSLICFAGRDPSWAP